MYELAILEYDTESNKYALHIPKDINSEWLPAIPYCLYEKGIYDVDDYRGTEVCKRTCYTAREAEHREYFKNNRCPPYYTEFAILEYYGGRCCMDEFYLEEIKGPLQSVTKSYNQLRICRGIDVVECGANALSLLP